MKMVDKSFLSSYLISRHGEVPEWTKGLDWKSSDRLKAGPRVRIPPSPPFFI